MALAGVLVGLGLGVLVGVAGCEETVSTPPSGQGGLSQDPTSLPGRSAKRAKDVGAMAENRQAQAAGMADEMSGQASTYELGGMSFKVPTSWTKGSPASNFIAAEYQVDGDGGAGRLTFSFFEAERGSGGTIDQNVARWESQFIDEGNGGSVVAYPTKRTVAGCQVTLVTLEGMLKGGTPGGPASDTPGQALRGAMIDCPSGRIVVKLTGPAATVDGAAGQWDMMIEGMTKKGR